MQLTLYPHQQSNINRMRIYEDNRGSSDIETDVGFVTDAPGFGKSYCVLGLIATDPDRGQSPTELLDIGEPLRLHYRRRNKGIRAGRTTSVIFCPTNTVTQWSTYCHAMMPVTETLVYTQKIPRTFNFAPYTIVIVAQTNWVRFVQTFTETHVWRRCVYDDVETNYTPGFIVPHATFHWFLSATIKDIVSRSNRWTRGRGNNVINVLVQPDLIEQLEINNTFETLQASVSQISNNVIRKIHAVILPHIVSHLSQYIDNPDVQKALLIGDAEAALTFMNGGVLKCTTLYDAVTERLKHRLSAEQSYLRQSQSPELVKTHTAKCKQIEQDIEEMRRKYETIMSEECFICIEPMVTPVLLPCCNSVICGKCICTLLLTPRCTRPPCPMCRTPMSAANMYQIKQEAGSHTRSVPIAPQPKTVLDHIVNLVTQSTDNQKFLIACDLDGTLLAQLQKKLGTKIIKPLKGHATTRAGAVAGYMTGDVKCLFLNTTFNAAGLNFENTTDIILCHLYNKSVETQILGRALRCNRTVGDLTVHTFDDISIRQDTV